MTTITIESDSVETTQLLLQIAAEHGLTARADEHRVLTAQDMVTGIDRKATEKELIEYLLKGENSEMIDIETAFAKYSDQ